MSKTHRNKYFDRELSWLSFNGRVLQEAKDPSVPLFDRLAFLAIFSSNLDEFFRVRVASLRSLLRLKKKSLAKLDFNLERLLKQIHTTVAGQQEEFGRIYRQTLRELEGLGILLIDETQVGAAQEDFLRAYFEEQVRAHAEPVLLECVPGAPFLDDRHLYLAVELWPPAAEDAPAGAEGAPAEGEEEASAEAEDEAAEGGEEASAEAEDEAAGVEGPVYGLVEVPSFAVPRFVWVPGDDQNQYVMFLDDVVRFNLSRLFPGFEVGGAYSIKLSRDAELYLEDEFSGDLIAKIQEGLAKRGSGVPTRLLYDPQMPYAMLQYLRRCLGLEDEDFVPGGRYHNLNDLHQFPRFGLKSLQYEPLPPHPHPVLEGAASIFAEVERKDQMLHFPYQSFDYVLRFLREAAHDPDVEEIWVTLYRVAPRSAVVELLLEAAAQGKWVTAFVEVKARFDEEPNLRWAAQMEAAGIRVLYSMPGLKVHAKLLLVERREGGHRRRYTYLATGNFNEKTARIYADDALLTADPRLTDDVRRVFGYLSGEVEDPACEHLIVAPFALRKQFLRLVDREIEHARNGRPARMILKMNSLEDDKMIARLYRASQAGVEIDLIVRGICRLVPGVRGQSENIRVRSIVDRFLEHARVYIFHNDGAEEYYLASADWMKRNLSRRIEVAFPVYDETLRHELRAIMDLQLADNTKARVIDEEQQNRYVPADGNARVRAQAGIYDLFDLRLEVARAAEAQAEAAGLRPEPEPVEDRAAMRRVLSSTPVLHGLDEAELEAFARLLEPRRFRRGELLPSDDDACRGYLVREGGLVLERPERPGMSLGPGDLFGATGVVDPDLEAGTVRVLEDSLLYAFDGRAVLDRRKLPARAALKLLRGLARAVAGQLRTEAQTTTQGLLQAGESRRVAFLPPPVQAPAEAAVDEGLLMTLASLLNTDGGVLLVGLDAGGEVAGLEDGDGASAERLLQRLEPVLRDAAGVAPGEVLAVRTERVGGKALLRLDCRPAPRPVFVPPHRNGRLYVRTGARTTYLAGDALRGYLHERFGLPQEGRAVLQREA